MRTFILVVFWFYNLNAWWTAITLVRAAKARNTTMAGGCTFTLVVTIIMACWAASLLWPIK